MYVKVKFFQIQGRCCRNGIAAGSFSQKLSVSCFICRRLETVTKVFIQSAYVKFAPGQDFFDSVKIFKIKID